MAKKGRPDLPPLFGPQPEPTVQEAFSIIVEDFLESEIALANQDKADINAEPLVYPLEHKEGVSQRLSSLYQLFSGDNRTSFRVFQDPGDPAEKAYIRPKKPSRNKF